MDQTVTTATLTVRGLTKRFGGLTAVKNLSFELHPGEILGLIGPNGSGKSTAMKSVMGIERPTAGEVLFEGENVAGLPAHKIARKGFGMVFQHSRPLNRQTVLENIMVALLPDSLFMLFPDKALTERAKWIADRVGLGAVMDRRPPTLPFAHLRRLELAKAIARDPKVVLVDEPFPDKGYYYRSDQFNFAKIGVPSLYFKAGTEFVGRPAQWGREVEDRWRSERYHQPSDHVYEEWDLEGLVEDARLAFLVGLSVAEADEPPAWNPGDEFEGVRTRMLREAE